MTVLSRDTSFRSLRGQSGAVDVLCSSLESGRVSHAQLFAGPDGVGKRTAFLKWAQVLLCPSPVGPALACEECPSCRRIEGGLHPDIFLAGFQTQALLLKEPVEKQKSIKIDTIREMERALRLKPSEGRVKIALIDPADDLVDAAAHALLKILEEPPPGTHLVLLSVDPGSLLDTIRSRCQIVRFRPLSTGELRKVLEDRAARGELLEPDRFEPVIAAAEGSVGRALDMLGEAESLDFDWEGAALSELLSWCEQFGSPRLGRDAAEDFLRRLLARFRTEAAEGCRSPSDMARIAEALERVRRFVNPGLVLQACLLRLRWERKKRS